MNNDRYNRVRILSSCSLSLNGYGYRWNSQRLEIKRKEKYNEQIILVHKQTILQS